MADPGQTSEDGCASTGIAGAPTLSRHGERLAFLASTYAKGRSGTDRVDGPSSIFEVDADGTASLIYQGIWDGFELRWALDDRFLIVAGTIGTETGTFAISADGKRTVKVSDIALDSFDVDSTGRRIVGVVGSKDPDNLTGRIYTVDLPASFDPS